MNGSVTPTKRTYAGLFMVTLATLMYEILLTRIFSVTMWYHFAFMAISVAMFGMTVGAVLVYLFPDRFSQERVRYHLAVSSLLFVPGIILSFLMHLALPLDTAASSASIANLGSLFLTYAGVSVPFVCSGTCVCLALTKYPQQVSKLYAADLAGAALGCILVIYTLSITDAPTAVIVVAALACIGALLFAADAAHSALKWIALISCFLLTFLAAGNTVLVNRQRPLLRLAWAKGRRETPPLHEKWNSFSRITVHGNPTIPTKPFGWGLSPAYPVDRKVRQLYMTIDATAGTILTAFDGELTDLEHLRYDVTNLAHYVRPNSKVLVVGSGGGRDVLSALAFGQKSVVAVEYNEDILRIVNRRFGKFTGRLDRHPQVTFVNDEARSYVARLSDAFDIIQVSLIDTWAATAAGAFVLTENSLYTVEAWAALLERLTPDGVLTFSRWYFRDRPGEVYRLTSLAATSLARLGVKDPRKHIVIVRCITRGQSKDAPEGIGTILLSKAPFGGVDLAAIDRVIRKMHFDLVLSPKFALDDDFATIASGQDLDRFVASFPINIAPPTDDSPFFFHMLRLRDVLDQDLRRQGWMSFNMRAVSVLGILLIIVVALTFLCIVVPLILTTKRQTLRGALPLLAFFSSIGLGFMLIEISQMQKLIVFLGHPVYGLSVVLFSLLLSSGLGSYVTQQVGGPRLTRAAIARLLLLLLTLGAVGASTSHAITEFRGSATTVRIIVAVGILLPVGFFMGMAFPLGMKRASARSASLTPWLWGINGAMSVCASVLAVAIALAAGISTAFWVGVCCYVGALAAFIWASRPNHR